MFAEKSKTLKRMFLHAMQLQSISSAKTTEVGVAVNTTAKQKDPHSMADLSSESPVVTSDESDDSIHGRVKKRKKSVRFIIEKPPDINHSNNNEQNTKSNHDTDDCDIAVDEITETDQYDTVEQISIANDTVIEKITAVDQITDTDEDGMVKQITNEADTAIDKPTNTDVDDSIEITDEGNIATDQITDKDGTSEQVSDPEENEIEQVTDSKEGDAAVAQHGSESDIEQCQSLPLKSKSDSHNKPLKKKITCFACERRVFQSSLRWHMNQLHGYSFATLDDCLNLYKQRNKKIAQSERRKVANNFTLYNICQICKNHYSTKTNLRRHLKNIHKYKLKDLDEYFLKRKYKLKKNTAREQNSSVVGNSDSNINSGTVCKLCRREYRTTDILSLHLRTFHKYRLKKLREYFNETADKDTKSDDHIDKQIEAETEINSQMSSPKTTLVDLAVGNNPPPIEGTPYTSCHKNKRRDPRVCYYCKTDFKTKELLHLHYIYLQKCPWEEKKSASPKVSSQSVAHTGDQVEQETEINSPMSSHIDTSDDEMVGEHHPSQGTTHNSCNKVKIAKVVCTFCNKKYKSKKLLWKHIRNDLCKKNPTKQKIGHKVARCRNAQNDEKNEQMESNSQIFDPSSGQDKLSVAILTADGNQLNEEQAMKIKKLLQCKILTEAKDCSNSASLPRFTTVPTLSDGVLKLQCKDDSTVKWLRNAVQNLHYYTKECPKLTLIRQCELNKVRVTLSLPDCDSSLDDVMLVLNRQNEWAFVNTWTVLTHKMLNNGTLFLALAIPKEVFPSLEKENLQLFYNLGSVKLRLYNFCQAVTDKQSKMEHGKVKKPSAVVSMQPDTSTGE